MKLKQKAQDFRVNEILDKHYLKERGRFRIYRVTKTKLTSLEAAAALADLAGVPAGEVGMAGLKDRQGVTTQFMSVKNGRPVFSKHGDLRIEPAGYAAEELTSAASLGNEFEITVRGLTQVERDNLVVNVAEVKAYGLPNYFGEQRFGNLRHGQGWIARDLAQGRHELALKSLLCGRSDNDDARSARFKAALATEWGEWRECREIAGKFRAHISVFQHLMHAPDDFAGAFRYIASKLRLIHLYAWQSHVWNRAVAAYFDEITPKKERFAVPSPEGPLVFARGAMAIDPTMNGTFRLPGPGLDDVKHAKQRDLLALALRDEGLQPHEFRVEGVSGFQLKGEDRPLLVQPQHIKILESNSIRVIVSFDLPRGAYATLVMARLVPPTPGRDAYERAEARRAAYEDREAREERDDGDDGRGRGDRAGRGADARAPRSFDAHGSRASEARPPRGNDARPARSPDARPARADRGAPRPSGERDARGGDRPKSYGGARAYTSTRGSGSRAPSRGKPFDRDARSPLASAPRAGDAPRGDKYADKKRGPLRDAPRAEAAPRGDKYADRKRGPGASAPRADAAPRTKPAPGVETAPRAKSAPGAAPTARAKTAPRGGKKSRDNFAAKNRDPKPESSGPKKPAKGRSKPFGDKSKSRGPKQ
jgi:tRNA pseudouridine13 synthase